MTTERVVRVKREYGVQTLIEATGNEPPIVELYEIPAELWEQYEANEEEGERLWTEIVKHRVAGTGEA